MVLPPPPPPLGKRPVAFYDTECSPNYWLLKFRPRGQPAYSFRLHAGEHFSPDQVRRIRLLFDAFCAISFNGYYYDVPMMCAALHGYNTEQLKWLNDRIIPKQIKGQPKVQGAKPWELGLPEWQPSDHIDVMEVCPGAGSQNQYAGRIHYKVLQDLPYSPDHYLAPHEAADVDIKCENDLGKLEAIYDALAPMLRMREKIGEKYGLDLRSKSDAQMAEAVLRKRCELALGQTIYKPKYIDYNFTFRYKVPEFVSFSTPALQRALELVRASIFGIRPPASMRGDDEKGKCIAMPSQLEGLEIPIGDCVYKMGVGGLHSQEKKLVLVSNATHIVRMPDVASYYPNLMLNSGEFPPALGGAFLQEFAALKDERLIAKALSKALKKKGFEGTVEFIEADTENEGGKIMINGTFGKTGSPFSILWAPTMLIQTTLTGQLSLLMLIEWMHAYGIPVKSANTDGLVVWCPRDKVEVFDALIAEWQRRTGLEMETEDYIALYAKDVNNYIAIKTADDVKRKGEYGKGGLAEKKNPDVEICSDAVSDFLAKGVPIEYTIAACRDVKKFVTMTAVAGGGVKMWGEGPRKDTLVRDMVTTLHAHGWLKNGRKWIRNDAELAARTAYESCFVPQRPEYLGKVVRWYYGTNSPGPILYQSNGNTVGGSYGATPCMVLPDEFPADIDHAWYINKAHSILRDIGYNPT